MSEGRHPLRQNGPFQLGQECVGPNFLGGRTAGGLMNEATTGIGKYDYQIDSEEDSAKGRVVRMVGRDKTVLEVGCASGAMTRCLSEQLGCGVTGLEVNAEDAKKARPYCEAIHIADVERIDLVGTVGSDRFDVAVYADVLEHLRDPVAALRNTREVLSRDGYVVACVPNIAHAALAFELALGNFDYRSVGLLDDTHIHFFTKNSLLRTFEAAGYVVVRLERFMLAPQFTEFAVKPKIAREAELLKTLIDAHPESQTYQFVVKAVPLDRTLGGIVAGTSSLQAELVKLDKRLVEETERRIKAESDLEWLAGRWPMNWLHRLRHFISRRD